MRARDDSGIVIGASRRGKGEEETTIVEQSESDTLGNSTSFPTRLVPTLLRNYRSFGRPHN